MFVVHVHVHVKPEYVDRINTGNERAASVLIRGASDEWYRRACREAFEPRLGADDGDVWRRQFIHRDGICGLCRAGTRRGMDPLKRMLHVRHGSCEIHAMLRHLRKCFAGADRQINRDPLVELAGTGDVPAQRMAAVPS